MAATGGGESVVPRATIVRGFPPLADDPALHEHALQGGVERAFLDDKDLCRRAFDSAGNLEPVQLSGARRCQRPQDEHVERTWRNVLAHGQGGDGRTNIVCLCQTRECRRALSGSQEAGSYCGLGSSPRPLRFPGTVTIVRKGFLGRPRAAFDFAVSRRRRVRHGA
jgi:hypothetical protein